MDFDIKSSMIQICNGLRHIHNNGFIHRDIKPKNILYKEDTVFIADLGSACRLPLSYKGYATTRWYRAPEMVMRKPYDYKVDIWSLGCLFYFLLKKEHLFKFSSEVEYKRNFESLKRFEYLEDADFDENELDLLKGMLEFDPDKRMDIPDIIFHPYFS